MTRTVKTRIAPSPTGFMHIGTLRLALFDYLFAKRHGGVFLLRIEDTDQTRTVPGAFENLIGVLKETGLTPDEGPAPCADLWNGPYFQSERLPIYAREIQKMLDNGTAYRCFCSQERIDAVRKEQEELGLPTKYDGHCRNLTPDDVAERLAAGGKHVVRLKVPKGEKLVYQDAVRGRLEFVSSESDDQVLLKSDGFPTYHFAVVVDDATMDVTHVFRGEEWLSSLPKQILVARGLWVELPEYAHMPLILWKDRKKLSKRTGDVAVTEYLKKGYLIHALLNYIVFLGWNPKTTQELFTVEEMIAAFDIADINKAGAIFDEDKLDWMNAQYLWKLSVSELRSHLEKYLKEYQPDFFASTYVHATAEFSEKVLSELQTRLKRFDEYPELTKFFYGAPSYDTAHLLNEKMKVVTLADAKSALELALSIIPTVTAWDLDSIKSVFLAGIADAGLKNGQVLWPVRATLSGEAFSPGAFEMIFILGQDESAKRIAKMLEKLNGLC